MYFKTLFISLFITIFFIACGGGSSSSFKDSSNSSSIVMCNNTSTSWTSVKSGDTVNASASSQLRFDHDSKGQKQVCVVSGSATISKKDS